MGLDGLDGGQVFVGVGVGHLRGAAFAVHVHPGLAIYLEDRRQRGHVAFVCNGGDIPLFQGGPVGALPVAVAVHGHEPVVHGIEAKGRGLALGFDVEELVAAGDVDPVLDPFRRVRRRRLVAAPLPHHRHPDGRAERLEAFADQQNQALALDRGQ